MSCEYVEDCQVHSSSLRLRFRASTGPAVSRLFARIQLDGEVGLSVRASPGRRWGGWWEPAEGRGIRPGTAEPLGFPLG
jgi:hypothetical protein